MLLLDTSAWVEYFIGSQKGVKIRDILEGEEITTSIISLIELSCKAYKEATDFAQQMDFIKQHSAILNVDEEIVVAVGKTYRELRARNKKAGLADAVIATTAKLHNAYIVTCDYDFKGLEGIRLIS